MFLFKCLLNTYFCISKRLFVICLYTFIYSFDIYIFLLTAKHDICLQTPYTNTLTNSSAAPRRHAGCAPSPPRGHFLPVWHTVFADWSS